ncbi:hypothetical protein A2954_04235 [Candidatus Roizmanbacteria bacterium RIFCSPLOWO2_01_FULL_37_12]|uniref:Uncharacterized protein n=1 Tax=Candidatus Roizmanbacteria bacterium RIFCSPLOWO2_01_FULL_37_12 TaxID=1802056 RepID=A0A1F7IFQ9_9BACT|nr:MAG: hypothetical protein A3D76_06490 [Candidatus Roizmanbacteria bacterium RIFCSPHIGHO2_02_FULL_37_9b]OGK42192.1 MAG: hypothetical protein A2954_04235 [Candidatus Roizmanbacteria bacterium RIFCSPLOWO2_01_FULL_37_12]
MEKFPWHTQTLRAAYRLKRYPLSVAEEPHIIHSDRDGKTRIIPPDEGLSRVSPLRFAADDHHTGQYDILQKLKKGEVIEFF